jgi:hypothetical protein
MDEFRMNQRKIGGLGTNAKGAPVFPKKSKSAMNLRTIDAQPRSRSRSAQKVFRYNLSPDYQHVKACFQDTSKVVEKLRLEAQQKREDLRRKRQLAQEQRLSHWGLEPEKPEKSKKASL